MEYDNNFNNVFEISFLRNSLAGIHIKRDSLHKFQVIKKKKIERPRL